MGVRRLAVLVASFVLVAACTSSKSSGGASGMPTTAAGLSSMMRTAVANVRSAHIDLDVTIAGEALTGSGSEKLSNGRLVALDVTEQLPQGGLRLIVVNGKTYVKLPSSLNAHGKPYLLVSKNSKNPVVRALAGSLDSALSSASLGTAGTFAEAAKTFKLDGTTTLHGVSVTHYTIGVDVAKLPSDLPGRQELIAGGVQTIPLELYVDHQGRPIQVTEDFSAQGQQVRTTVVVTGYDQPVTITAPPADQVGS
jgi:hypothetical protein